MSKKTLAICMSALLVLLLVSSSALYGAHSHHNCLTGQHLDCLVCVVLQGMQSLLRNLFMLLPVALLLAAVLLPRRAAPRGAYARPAAATPVSSKVRINP